MVEQKIKGFISHRCKEYDEAPWKNLFEEFLKSKGIIPIYGCLLQDNTMGSLSLNIKQSIIVSDIYIAVVTKSWIETQQTDKGWPKKELEMWKSLKEGRIRKDMCIGFLIDTPRNQVEFISDVVSFNLTGNDNQSEYSEILFGNIDIHFKTRKRDFDKIDSQLTHYKNLLKPSADAESRAVDAVRGN